MRWTGRVLVVVAVNANVELVKSQQVQGTSNAVGAPGTQQLTCPGTAPAKTETFPVTVK